MSYIDLHVHSCASDGTMTPEEVVDCAARAGLSAIALTDHDTTAGVSRALEAEKKKTGGRSSHAGGDSGHGKFPAAGNRDGKETEIHMLGLFLPPGNSGVQKFLDDMISARDARKPRDSAPPCGRRHRSV